MTRIGPRRTMEGQNKSKCPELIDGTHCDSSVSGPMPPWHRLVMPMQRATHSSYIRRASGHDHPDVLTLLASSISTPAQCTRARPLLLLLLPVFEAPASASFQGVGGAAIPGGRDGLADAASVRHSNGLLDMSLREAPPSSMPARPDLARRHHPS